MVTSALLNNLTPILLVVFCYKRLDARVMFVFVESDICEARCIVPDSRGASSNLKPWQLTSILSCIAGSFSNLYRHTEATIKDNTEEKLEIRSIIVI